MSTSSETMVMRCSRKSTATRIDWLALLPPSSSAGSAAALAGFADSGSTAVWRKARSRSSRLSSPERSGRSSTCGTRVPTVFSSVAGGPSRATRRSRSAMRVASSPSGSRCSRSSVSRMPLMRSMVASTSVTASAVTGRPSRNLPISVSAACASASSRGSPRNPQVPLMVWTSRKMLSRILALLGSCSKRTSSTSTTSRLSWVSVTNSRNRSSIENAFIGRLWARSQIPSR